MKTHYGLRFDRIEHSADIRATGDFMHRNVGTYDPARYHPWVDTKHLPEIGSGERRANGWWQDELIVATMGLKILSLNIAEVKYFRVAAPNFTGRGLGDFTARQIGPEAVELLAEHGMISPDANEITIQLDTTAGSAAEHFFARRGFAEVGRAELYTAGKEEVIMQRAVRLD